MSEENKNKFNNKSVELNKLFKGDNLETEAFVDFIYSKSDNIDFPEDQVNALSLNDLGILLRGLELRPDIFASNFDVLTNAFKKSQMIEIDSQEDYYLRHDIGQSYRFCMWSLANEKTPSISFNQVLDVFDLIKSENRRIRFHTSEMMGNLIILGRKLQKDNNINLLDRFDQTLIEYIDSDQNIDNETATWMVDVVWADMPGRLSKLLIDSLKRSSSEKSIKLGFSLFANRLSSEKSRELIKTATERGQLSEKKFNEIEQVLGFNPNTMANLVELYGKILFENYAPNKELQKRETELLLKILGTKSKILDVGCGTGRLVKSLSDSGKEMTAIDLVDSHVQIAAKNSPEADVLQASWHNLPFGKKKFEAAYMLGRNFLHEPDPEKKVELLAEVSRVLDDEGVLILDTPKIDEGHYQQHRDLYQKAAEKLGVDYYEKGSIVDSPDGKHYFDRLVPTDKQLESMAALAGFDIELYTETEYLDAEGGVNTNRYWKLTKRKRPLEVDEAVSYRQQLKTSVPLIYITWI